MSTNLTNAKKKRRRRSTTESGAPAGTVGARTAIMTHTEAAAMKLSEEGVVGVPLKFVLVRGRRVVEQRRTRLLCPSLEDVKGCVRQWACGAFTLRYVDDEGDLVTMDLDEEWDECVALWREAQEADDADVCGQQRALRLVVTIGAQDGSAVCLGQQRHPRQAFWERQHRGAQRDGHHHDYHMYGRHGGMPGLDQLLAEWQAHAQTHGQEQNQAGDKVDAVQEGMPCCRRSVKHAGEHGPRCRLYGWKCAPWADAADVPQAAVAEVRCAGEGCSYAVTRRHGTHCCHMCARGGGQHGPRCEQRHMETSDVEAAPAVVGEDVSQSVKEGMPCCRKSMKHAGKHGPHCRVYGWKSAGATDVVMEQTLEPLEPLKSLEVSQSAQDVVTCCRRSAKHAGKHGPRCRVYGRKSATEAAVAPIQEEVTVPDAALLVCAGCSFEVTGVHATHCCVRCAKHAGQHGPRCQQKMPMAAEEGVKVDDKAAVVEECEGVTALRNMGFEVTADVRAVLEKHNGDVAAVLEEMM